MSSRRESRYPRCMSARTLITHPHALTNPYPASTLITHPRIAQAPAHAANASPSYQEPRGHDKEDEGEDREDFNHAHHLHELGKPPPLHAVSVGTLRQKQPRVKK